MEPAGKNFNKHYSRQDSIIFVAISALTLWVCYFSWTRTYDDAFITYRHAYNFAAGNGLVFNVGTRSLSTSTPLYALVLGVVAGAFGPDTIPQIAGILSGLSLLCLTNCLYAIGRKHSRLAGFLWAVSFLAFSDSYDLFGGEMFFLLMLLVLGVLLYLNNRTLLSSAVLAFAALTRIEAILFAGCFALYQWVRVKRFPYRETGVIAAIVLPAMLIIRFYYGAVLPISVWAKYAQSQSGLWPMFRGHLINWFAYLHQHGSSFDSVTLVFFLVILLLGIYEIFRSAPSARLPALCCLSSTLFFVLSGAPTYHWYLAPTILLVALVFSLGLTGLLQSIQKIHTLRTNSALATAITFLLIGFWSLDFCFHFQSIPEWSPPPSQHALYEKTGRWLEKFTEPNATVGYLEIGRIGFYSRRRMVDPAGILDRNVQRFLVKKNLFEVYRQTLPDVILYNRLFAWTGDMLKHKWFTEHYTYETSIRDAQYSAPIAVYFRRK